jgi:nucleosome binding factor SPN SPT16 subunit
VPFHVSAIKSVSKIDDPGAGLLRFNFFFPVGSVPKEASQEMRLALERFPNKAYFKELTYRVRDAQALNAHFRAIKDMQKRVRDRAKQQVEETGLVDQKELVLLKERRREAPATLEDVSMLPSLSRSGQAISKGRLRAHVNGFRYSSDKQGDVDVIYTNIKFLFYQPPTKDVSKVLIHLYLRDPILVGRKKTRHVQFFTDVTRVRWGAQPSALLPR